MWRFSSSSFDYTFWKRQKSVAVSRTLTRLFISLNLYGRLTVRWWYAMCDVSHQHLSGLPGEQCYFAASFSTFRRFPFAFTSNPVPCQWSPLQPNGFCINFANRKQHFSVRAAMWTMQAQTDEPKRKKKVQMLMIFGDRTPDCDSLCFPFVCFSISSCWRRVTVSCFCKPSIDPIGMRSQNLHNQKPKYCLSDLNLSQWQTPPFECQRKCVLVLLCSQVFFSDLWCSAAPWVLLLFWLAYLHAKK